MCCNMKRLPVQICLGFLVQGIAICKAELTVIPSPVAFVQEYRDLQLQFKVSGFSNYTLVYVLNGVTTTNTFLSENCNSFGEPLNTTLYQLTCNSKAEFTFTIKNVTNQRHGEKWSFKTNAADTSSQSTEIFVQVPVKSVSFTEPEGETIHVKENHKETFTCITSLERPRSTIKWFFNGGILAGGDLNPTENDTYSETTGKLNYAFYRNQTGKMYCTAANMDNAAPKWSNNKTVVVYYGTDGPPVIMDFENGSIYKAIEATQQHLSCYVEGGHPKPTLTWQCFSGVLFNTTTAQNRTWSNITWSPYRDSVSTVCSCVSNQSVSGIQSSSLIVEVLYPPSKPEFSIGNSKVQRIVKVIRHENIKIVCSSSANPEPEYEWTSLETISGRNLDLHNVQDNLDQREFTCHATNAMVDTRGMEQRGTNYSSVVLDVLFPPTTPTFMVGSVPITGKLSVVQDDDVVITCKSTSDPEPDTFQWKDSFENSNTITINSIQESVEKRCVVKNNMTTYSGATVLGSANASLNIIVMKGPTVPKLKYIYNGTIIRGFERELVVILETSFDVQCTGSTSIPGPPTYSWFGLRNTPSDLISFTRIGAHNAGVYTCRVENTMIRTVGERKNGSNSTQMHVEVLYPPNIEEFETQSIVENNQLSLRCKATGNPSPLSTSYRWTRSKDTFSQQSSFLQIDHTRRDDADTYTCTVHNTMTPSFSREATLGEDKKDVQVKILYYPDVKIYQMNQTTITEGDLNVMIVCVAIGEPSKYNFSKWIHYDPVRNTVIREITSSVLEYDRAYLTFANATYMDSGVYECRVSNGIKDYKTGNLTALNSTLQVVKGRPVIIHHEKVVVSSSHQTALLSITYYSNGDTDPTVMWYKKDRTTRVETSSSEERLFYQNSAFDVIVMFYNAPIAAQGNKTELIIQNISMGDFGEYEVNISNSVGAVVLTTLLVPQGPPDPPRKLSVLDGSTTSSSVILTWVSGFHNGANQTFYIQYNTTSTSWQNKSSIEGGELVNTAFNATVDQLQAKTQYFFRILASTVYGRNYSSVITEVTTDHTEAEQKSSLTGPAVGGGIGGAIVVIGLAVLIVFLRRRNSKESPSKSLFKDSERPTGIDGPDDTAEINLNPMYESAGPLPSTSNISDVYSQVDKSRKKTKPVGDIYSQVDKPKNRQNTSGSEVKNDVNAQVQKQQRKEKDSGKTKQKKQIPDKKTKKGKQTEGDLYDNVDTINSAVTIGDAVYENPSCSIKDENPKQMRNQDGLIYADLDLSKEPVWEGRKAVIHGLDDMTDYADIKYGEVGAQAPESDEENTKKE